MTKYEYDAEASARHRMDVVHEVAEVETGSPAAAKVWLDAMRRLNAIDDPLARRLIELHRDCGSGTGECDSSEDWDPDAVRVDWGCETLRVIAGYYAVGYLTTTGPDQ